MSPQDDLDGYKRDEERFFKQFELDQQELERQQKNQDIEGASAWVVAKLEEHGVKIKELQKLHRVLKQLGTTLGYKEADATDFADRLMSRLIDLKLAEPSEE